MDVHATSLVGHGGNSRSIFYLQGLLLVTDGKSMQIEWLKTGV
jgi:hypothetical protein